jgi:hypothetical protein
VKFFNRNPYRDQLRADAEALGVPKGERIMATGMGPKAYQPAVVIATDQALYYAATTPVRIEWPEIAKAQWEQPWLSLLTVSGERIKLHLDPAGELPPVIRDRVTASVLIRERVPLDMGGTVVCVGRREPASDHVTWLLEFDPDSDPTDPQISASADRALAELRATLGV